MSIKDRSSGFIGEQQDRSRVIPNTPPVTPPSARWQAMTEHISDSLRRGHRDPISPKRGHRDYPPDGRGLRSRKPVFV